MADASLPPSYALWENWPTRRCHWPRDGPPSLLSTLMLLQPKKVKYAAAPAPPFNVGPAFLQALQRKSGAGSDAQNKPFKTQQVAMIPSAIGLAFAQH